MALAKLIFKINFAQHSFQWVIDKFPRKFVSKSKILCRNSDVSTNYNHYKNILWLVFFEGFSNREAAIILKKSERQIKNLLYRAKQSLKQKLEKEGFVYEEL